MCHRRHYQGSSSHHYCLAKVQLQAMTGKPRGTRDPIGGDHLRHLHPATAWHLIRDVVMRRDNYTCTLCGAVHAPFNVVPTIDLSHEYWDENKALVKDIISRLPKGKKMVEGWKRICLSEGQWSNQPAMFMFDDYVTDQEKARLKYTHDTARAWESQDYSNAYWKRKPLPGVATESLDVHHLIPRSREGSDHPENLVTVCPRCHHHRIHGGKGNASNPRGFLAVVDREQRTLEVDL